MALGSLALPDGAGVVDELQEAVAEAAEELGVVVAGAEHQGAVLDELVQRVDDAHHVSDAVRRRTRQLVQDRAVQTLVQVLRR